MPAKNNKKTNGRQVRIKIWRTLNVTVRIYTNFSHDCHKVQDKGLSATSTVSTNHEQETCTNILIHKSG